MNYKDTLNLPQTTFPMRANAPVREPEFQALWTKLDIYRKNLEQRNKGTFILHDGPPYLSSNKIHIGHALNRTLKDIVVKYKTLNGLRSPLVFGYDCHGLPIEHEVSKTLGAKRHEMSDLEIRKFCQQFALQNLDGQIANFHRLGLMGDWKKPYLTMEPAYEAIQLRVFGEMVEKGYIYKGLKPIYWCTSCETALAEAEVEYADHTSPSIYVRMKLKTTDMLPETLKDKPTYLVIWTTTPWTLPANLGVALNPDFDYGFLETSEGELLVVADKLKDTFLAATGLTVTLRPEKIKGHALENAQCQHPFYHRTSQVILGQHVTAEAGTGCVHTAPGHGMDDFIVGVKYKLGILSPLDNCGIFTSEAPLVEGMYYQKANPEVIRILEEKENLVHQSTLAHSYPHCWRCKNPVIYRATEQWFASVDGFREEALKAVDDVTWIPASGKERISSMIRDRTDWCISRQRVWGVPIPAFYCQNTNCHATLLNKTLILHVASIFEEKGSDAWWEKEASELMPKGYTCPQCQGDTFKKESDIMDVWFDSGTSHSAVLTRFPDLHYPADLYLEGSDQHRGWFQSSLLTAIAATGTPPYKTVITHGFTLDGDGRKMSKSLGNTIAPQKVIDEYGADVLRLWVASVDYSTDVRISHNNLKQLADVYRKIRNTARFLISNLYDFTPETDCLPYNQLSELDRYTLHRIQELVQQVRNSFERYAFYQFYQLIQNFCVLDLSNFYFAIVKDILYIEKKDGPLRRSVQTVLWECLQILSVMIAPVLTHLAEDIWQNLPENLKGNLSESVLLANYPQPQKNYQDFELANRWQEILNIRDTLNMALESARNQKIIGKSLEAKALIYVIDDTLRNAIKSQVDLLRQVFIISDLELLDTPPQEGECHQSPQAIVSIMPAQGQKCVRCWNIVETVGLHTEHPELCQRCVDAI